jgi:hypothetical protein
VSHRRIGGKAVGSNRPEAAISDTYQYKLDYTMTLKRLVAAAIFYPST